MDDFNFAFPLGRRAEIEPLGGIIVGQDALKTIWPNGSLIPRKDGRAMRGR